MFAQWGGPLPPMFGSKVVEPSSRGVELISITKVCQSPLRLLVRLAVRFSSATVLLAGLLLGVSWGVSKDEVRRLVGVLS